MTTPTRGEKLAYILRVINGDKVKGDGPVMACVYLCDLRAEEQPTRETLERILAQFRGQGVGSVQGCNAVIAWAERRLKAMAKKEKQ
jgi:hypothetical protein